MSCQSEARLAGTPLVLSPLTSQALQEAPALNKHLYGAEGREGSSVSS